MIIKKLKATLNYLTSSVCLLIYANENGCPWSEHTCKWATLNGH